MFLSYLEQSKYREGQPKEKDIYGRIREYLHVDGVDKMILGVGDCRTGTTAWLAAAARAGFPAYYQPAKAALRCIKTEKNGERLTPQHIHFGEKSNIVVAKETIGPQNHTESTLDPVKSYTFNHFDNKGLNTNQLHVVFFVRNPVAILQSWHRIFGGGVVNKGLNAMHPDVVDANFVTAAQTEMGIYEELHNKNIPHTVFAQELLTPPEWMKKEDHHIHYERILSKIFNRAGAPITDEQAYFAVNNWQQEGSQYLLDRITFPTEPVYNFEGGISPTLESPGYRHVANNATLADITNDDLRDTFQTAELTLFYNELLQISAKHLDVDASDYERFYLS